MLRRQGRFHGQLTQWTRTILGRADRQKTTRPFASELLEFRHLLAADLIITGIIDGPLSGGTPKAIELYATAEIPELNTYAVGSANNGEGSDGPEFILSGSVSQGQYLYVASEAANFEAFFGFAPDFISGAAAVNGDDAIELFYDGNADGFTNPDLADDDVVVDVFGEVTVDGGGEPWDYTDGWAYRASTSIQSSPFMIDDWAFSGINALDGELNNADSLSPFPIGSYAATPGPEINVTPVSGTDANFGVFVAGSSVATQTFLISNTGSEILNLSGSPTVSITGSSDFAISVQPDTVVAPSESTEFAITFTPTLLGNQTATISIISDDIDENPYTFTVEAFVNTADAPEIEILGNGRPISRGSQIPNESDDTDFGAVSLSNSVTKTFTIDNSAGTAPLLISSIVVSGNHESDFQFGSLPAEVEPGQSSAFDVSFMPESIGTRTATITVNSNDIDEAEYDFAIQGAGINVTQQIVINEVDADTTGNDTEEFIELYDGGVGNSLLAGLVVVLLNGNGNTSYGTFDLDGFSTNAAGFFVLGNEAVPNVDLVIPNSRLQNGEDAVAIYIGDASDFPNGTVGTTQDLMDAVIYETGNDADTTLADVLGLDRVIDEAANANANTESVSRSPDGGEFVTKLATPGASNGAIVLLPEIDVLGDGVAISNGDTTPNPFDLTDFGSAVQDSEPQVHTFVIENSGNGELQLQEIVVSGGSNFSVSQPDSTTVPPGGSQTFTVTLTPLAVGAQSATVSISSDDADENPFSFDVRGVVSAAEVPEIDVIGNGVSIIDGDTTPDSSDGTDFGAVRPGATLPRQFTIDNSAGTAALTISEVTISGTHDSDFSLGEFPTSVRAGGTAIFEVQFSPTSDGLKTATVTIASNDSDESSYSFAIQGTGITVAQNVVINEVDADTEGSDTAEFIELYDGGVGSTSLHGLVVVLFNGGGPASYKVFDLQGARTTANGFFVLGNAAVPNVDFVIPNSSLQNGEDGVALYVGKASDFPNGREPTTTDLLDAVVYETGNDSDTELVTKLGLAKVIDENSNSNASTESVSRSPDGSGDFFTVIATPGAANAAPQPEIEVLGAEQLIVDGDDTPSVADLTDYGSFVQGEPEIEHTFRIFNQGPGNLTLGEITLDGSGDFSLTQPTMNAVLPNGSQPFSIRFSPSSIGVQVATVTIPNNDADESPYTFVVSGSAVPPASPEIDIYGNDQAIVNGDLSPSPDDGTDFGDVRIDGALTQTFVIDNTAGSTPLTISNIAISGANADEFSLGRTPNIVPTGETVAFDVDFEPQNLGLRAAVITIVSDDSDEATFDFAIQGTGITVANHIVINEVDADTEGSDTEEFIELYDGGIGTTSLTGLTIVLFNGGGPASYKTFNLDGYSTDEAGYFTLGNAAVPDVDFVIPDSSFQNGEDAVALYIGSPGDFPNGSSPTTDGLLDAVIYETGNDADTDLGSMLGLDAVIDENANSSAAIESVSRSPNGSGPFVTLPATPGEPNPEPVLPPKILVVGGGKSIANGDASPAIEDNTDYGSITVGTTVSFRSFAIFNRGQGPLTVEDITISGAPEFTMLPLKSRTIEPDQNELFQVTLTPLTSGKKSATLTIVTDDPNQSPFTFIIEGFIEPMPAPEIDVVGNGQSIANGDDSPNTSDGTDFGNVSTGGSTTRTFTIDNSAGIEPLNVAEVSVGGANADDFKLGFVPSAIAAGESANFEVIFSPTSDNLRSASVTIWNNDEDESSYAFDIQGTGIVIPDNVVINEVDADTTGTDTEEFIELYDGGTGDTSLAGLVIVLFNGNGPTSYNAFDLNGFSTDANGFFVIGNASTANVDYVIPDGTLQNGEDGVAIYIGSAVDFPNGTAPTTSNLLDAVVYETGNDADTTLASDLSLMQVVDENSASNGNTNSVSRIPNGDGAFATATATPGQANVQIVPEPELIVSGKGVEILNNDVTPDSTDDTDFGSIPNGSAVVTHIFNIFNGGNNALTLGSLSLEGSTAFTVSQPANSVIAAGDDIEFSITFTPNLDGTETATLKIPHDADEGLFAFALRGTTTNVPREPVEGIVINEVMQNPSAVNDSVGEYIELWNTTSVEIDLLGWVIRDDATESESHTITAESPVTIPAGGFFVIGNHGDAATNGGVAVDYAYTGVSLGNGADGIRLEDPTGKLVDAVFWDDSSFPITAGASMELLPGTADPINGNDLAANWKTSVGQLLPGGDRGTPGSANGVFVDSCLFNPGDLDGNGLVEFLDFLILASNFGMTNATPELGDLNCDTTIGFSDFLVLARNFGHSVVIT